MTMETENMTTETEDILWISAQQDRIIPRELVIFANEKNKSLYDLFKMEEEDFRGIDRKVLDKFLSQREKIDFVKYQEIYDLLQKNSMNLIKYSDPSFPQGLRKLDDKGIPVMLYHQGVRVPFLNCIAIVGTRNCSTRGAEFANQISKELAKMGYVIVTGLARGIDAAAHRGAISVSGKTVGQLSVFLIVHQSDAYEYRSIVTRFINYITLNPLICWVQIPWSPSTNLKLIFHTTLNPILKSFMIHKPTGPPY